MVGRQEAVDVALRTGRGSRLRACRRARLSIKDHVEESGGLNWRPTISLLERDWLCESLGTRPCGYCIVDML